MTCRISGGHPFAAGGEKLGIGAAHQRDGAAQIPLAGDRPTRSSPRSPATFPTPSARNRSSFSPSSYSPAAQELADERGGRRRIGTGAGGDGASDTGCAITEAPRRASPPRPPGAAGSPGGRSTSSCSRCGRAACAPGRRRARPSSRARAQPSRDTAGGSRNAGTRPPPFRRRARSRRSCRSCTPTSRTSRPTRSACGPVGKLLEELPEGLRREVVLVGDDVVGAEIVQRFLGPGAVGEIGRPAHASAATAWSGRPRPRSALR